MQAWQSFAAALAIGLVGGGAYMLLTMRRRFSRIVVVLLSVPIPATGLALYALQSGPPPHVTQQSRLVSALVAISIITAIWRAWVRREMGPGKTVTTAVRANFNRYVLAVRGCTAVWITAYAGTFEPLFAVANLAVICAWVAFCIPRRWRHGVDELSVVLAARPAEVYQFLVEPNNWPRFQDVEDVALYPEGPLRVGSEVTTRRATPWSGRKLKANPMWITVTTRITALEPGVSYTAATVGRDDQVTNEVRPSGTGTTLTTRVDRTLPLPDAILGMMLEYRAELAARRQASLYSLQRLDGLIPSATRPG